MEDLKKRTKEECIKKKKNKFKFDKIIFHPSIFCVKDEVFKNL